MALSRSRAVVATLTALALAVGAVVPATAQQAAPTHEDYKDTVARLERARKLVQEAERKEKSLERAISSTQGSKQEMEAELHELTTLVEDAEARLSDAERVLDEVKAQLDAKTAEYNAALLELQDTHDMFSDRVVRVYMEGPASTFELLFGAKSWTELVERARMVGYVLTADQRRLEVIRALKRELGAQRGQIAELRLRTQDEVGRIQAERDRMAGLKEAVDARKAQLTRDLRNQQSSLTEVRQDKQTYLKQQKELEQESARIASFLRGRSRGTASVEKGEMLWPASGPVTSGYGWRTHPIYGDRRFHSGIDIGSPSGAPVKASAAGEVIYAAAKGGYGNTIMVDHGGGVVTLYAHLSGFSRGVGSQVAPGQQVGRVGCSGYCTGPHLHFEVRVNGEPQNPMAWLS